MHLPVRAPFHHKPFQLNVWLGKASSQSDKLDKDCIYVVSSCTPSLHMPPYHALVATCITSCHHVPCPCTCHLAMPPSPYSAIACATSLCPLQPPTPRTSPQPQPQLC